VQQDFTLISDPTDLELEEGIVLQAPGLTGSGSLYSGREVGETRSFDAALSVVDRGINDADLEERHTLVIEAPTPPADSVGVRAGGVSDDEILLTVPVGEGEAAIIIYRDEADVVTFHYGQGIQPGATADEGTRSRVAHRETFRIHLRPGDVKPVEAGATSGQRGDIGKAVAKVFKIVIVKLFPKQVGKFVAKRVKNWEDKKRSAQGLHGGSFAELLASAPKPLTSTKGFIGKKSLLFIHGTTSTTAGAFEGLSAFPDLMTRIYRSYDDRVIGFNHHTMSKCIAENVRDFYAALAVGEYTFDIVCHSRGGLLARALTQLSDKDMSRFLGVEWKRPAGVVVNVDRIVFVATPNAGTLLAEPKRIPQFVERLTNFVNMFPDGVLSISAGALMSIAGSIAEVGLPHLPGLADQAPESDLLKAINDKAAAARYFAFRVNFEPAGNFFDVIKDAVADRIFEKAQNDLVVPTLGVTKTSIFDLPAERLIEFGPKDGVHHTNCFRQDKIKQIADFLNVV
jgi:hypothetical protein